MRKNVIFACASALLCLLIFAGTTFAQDIWAERLKSYLTESPEDPGRLREQAGQMLEGFKRDIRSPREAGIEQLCARHPWANANNLAIGIWYNDIYRARRNLERIYDNPRSSEKELKPALSAFNIATRGYVKALRKASGEMEEHDRGRFEKQTQRWEQKGGKGKLPISAYYDTSWIEEE